MHYLKKTLADNEEIIQFFHFNKITYTFSFLYIIFGILLIIVGLIPSFDGLGAGKLLNVLWIPALTSGILLSLYGIYSYLSLKTIHMGITDRRVVLKRGIISIISDEIRLEAVETVEMKQSIIQRMFGIGNIVITGKGESNICFKNIDNPVGIKKVISSALNNKN